MGWKDHRGQREPQEIVGLHGHLHCSWSTLSLIMLLNICANPNIDDFNGLSSLVTGTVS